MKKDFNMFQVLQQLHFIYRTVPKLWIWPQQPPSITWINMIWLQPQLLTADLDKMAAIGRKLTWRHFQWILSLLTHRLLYPPKESPLKSATSVSNCACLRQGSSKNWKLPIKQFKKKLKVKILKFLLSHTFSY